MGFFSQIKSSVDSVLVKLFADPDLPVTVTWKVFTGSDWSEEEGINIETYSSSTIQAIRVEKEVGSMQTKAVPPGPWLMAMGDVVFLFKSGDVPAGAGIRDLLIDGEYTYGIRRILPIFDLITKVEVKGYA